MSFSQVFGGTAIRPSQPSYLALTLTANVTLVWPLETAGGQPYVAAQIDVSATSSAFAIAMPPANTGTPGAQSIVTNVGASSFTLTDNSGNQIATIGVGVSWLITLINNATVNGVWRAYQLGATTSNASAGSLAGYGLQAVSTQLQVQLPPFPMNASTTLTAAYRSGFVDWTGAAGTLQFDLSANLTAGWFCLITNNGSGALTLTGTGSEEINGAPSLILQVGNSAIVECTGSGFVTAGNTQSPLSIKNGGTGANNAPSALTSLGGTALGINIFTAPSAASVLTLLGITGVAFTESTISVNENLTAANSQTAFVATAALTLTLPLVTGGSIPTSFCVMIYAQGGAVTLTPQSLDQVNAGGAGVSLTIPKGGSCFLTTDANGNWWSFLGGLVQSGSITVGRPSYWAANGALGDSGGVVDVNVAGGSTVNLTSAQCAPETIVLTGALTANIVVTFQTLKNQWVVVNSTTGAFTVTIEAQGGTNGITIPQGQSAAVYGDGTNLFRANSDLSGASGTTATVGSNNLLLATTAYADRVVANYAPLASPTLTGIPAAPTAAPGTNTTQLATTAYALAAAIYASFGSSITNHDVTASRVLGTTATAPATTPPYTNSQPGSIFVNTSVLLTAQGNLLLKVNGTTINQNGNSAGILVSVCGFVPPGATYSVSTDNGGTLNRWVEAY